MIDIIKLRGVDVEVCECGNCGVVYTVPHIVLQHHREEGGFSFCPNGHQWGWSKENCEREKLRRERDRLAQRLAERDDEIKHQRELRESAERQAAAARGQVTKLKNRTSAGVCACCNRTFSQLARHMAQKHPGFKAEPIEGSTVVPLKIAAQK